MATNAASRVATTQYTGRWRRHIRVGPTQASVNINTPISIDVQYVHVGQLRTISKQVTSIAAARDNEARGGRATRADCYASVTKARLGADTNNTWTAPAECASTCTSGPRVTLSTLIPRLGLAIASPNSCSTWLHIGIELQQLKHSGRLAVVNATEKDEVSDRGCGCRGG